MTTEAQSTSVLTHVTVEAPLERAFRVFVEQFDKIKPREHNMLAADVAETVLEPRVGRPHLRPRRRRQRVPVGARCWPSSRRTG